MHRNLRPVGVLIFVARFNFAHSLPSHCHVIPVYPVNRFVRSSAPPRSPSSPLVSRSNFRARSALRAPTRSNLSRQCSTILFQYMTSDRGILFHNSRNQRGMMFDANKVLIHTFLNFLIADEGGNFVWGALFVKIKLLSCKNEVNLIRLN